MSYSLEDQVVSLAGVFQSAALVQQIAQKGAADFEYYEATVKSLFDLNPSSTIGIYGSLGKLRLGFSELAAALDKSGKEQNVEVIRYALSLIHLESKLRKRGDLMEIIGKRIAQANDQARHFDPLHENIIDNLASLYMDTISTFNVRIQVTGKPQNLKIEANAAKIRAILLAGIRAAMLWRQTGGRRWQLIFRRQRILEAVKALPID